MTSIGRRPFTVGSWQHICSGQYHDTPTSAGKSRDAYHRVHRRDDIRAHPPRSPSCTFVWVRCAPIPVGTLLPASTGPSTATANAFPPNAGSTPRRSPRSPPTAPSNTARKHRNTIHYYCRSSTSTGYISEQRQRQRRRLTMQTLPQLQWSRRRSRSPQTCDAPGTCIGLAKSSQPWRLATGTHLRRPLESAHHPSWRFFGPITCVHNQHHPCRTARGHLDKSDAGYLFIEYPRCFFVFRRVCCVDDIFAQWHHRYFRLCSPAPSAQKLYVLKLNPASAVAA